MKQRHQDHRSYTHPGERPSAADLDRRLYCQCERPNVVKPRRPLFDLGPPDSPTCLKCGRMVKGKMK